MEKIVRLGTVACGRSNVSVFCKIKLVDGRLSITGVEGPTQGGNCRGGCGQIDLHLRADEFAAFAPGWDRADVSRFLKLWGRWHLNDMRAGSAVQETHLRALDYDRAANGEHYTWAKSELAKVGLHPDADGYAYGSSWKSEELPSDVVEWLFARPDTDKTPAWI